MMSKKIPQCPAADKLDLEKASGQGQVARSTGIIAGCRNAATTGQRNGETTSSSPESGSLNGDGKRSGKSRRRSKKLVSNETKNDQEKSRTSAGRSHDPRVCLIGLQSECANVWFECNVYERAESLYQRWLACASNGTAQVKVSPPTTGKRSPSTASTSGPAAPKRPPQEVRVKTTKARPPTIPDSLNIPLKLQRASATKTPDDGYQSQALTPATPPTTPTPRQPINGLPRVPVELLRDVWLEKPLYDRAEAAFYQNLYGNNSSKRSSSTSISRSTELPQSLAEEEEEEEEVAVVVGEKSTVSQCKAEVFHALHPIQEEEEPAENPDKEDGSGPAVCYFLHLDSERVWLDKWRYDAAEIRFHSYNGGAVVGVKKGRRPEVLSVASSAPLRDNNMTTFDFLTKEKIWFEKTRYDEAERRFYESANGASQSKQDVGANTILQDIARARENIQKSLAGLKSSLRSEGSHKSSPPPSTGSTADPGELICRIKSLELENQSLYKVVDNLRAALSKLECRVSVLEKSPAAVPAVPAPSVLYTNGATVQQKTSALVKQEEEEEEDDMDLFGSDDDEEADKLKEQRLKEYAEKKAKKPGVIAKSSILLDVKPWDDETDMVKLEECVRSVQTDGLLWGTSKLVPVGYGIKKLQIACVVEDDKVGTDMLEEEITKFEDFVQSVDVAAFNKI